MSASLLTSVAGAVRPLPAGGVPADSAAEWVHLIQQAWSRSADNALELGRLMCRAKSCLPRGGWSRLWRTGGLPFSKRKGEKFVAIDRELGGLNANNCSQLPAAWNTLYPLARLGRPLVERLIQQGRIHCGLSLREARALLAQQRPESQRKSPPTRLETRLNRFTRFVRDSVATWSEEECEYARHGLLTLVEMIQKPARDAASREPLREAFSTASAQFMGNPAVFCRSNRVSLRPGLIFTPLRIALKRHETNG